MKRLIRRLQKAAVMMIIKLMQVTLKAVLIIILTITIIMIVNLKKITELGIDINVNYTFTDNIKANSKRQK